MGGSRWGYGIISEIRHSEAQTSAERMRRYRKRQRGEVDTEYSWNRKLKPGPKPKPGVRPAPEDARQYALDMSSPVRYVATRLEEAGKRGMSVFELADGYRHPRFGDITRVKRFHGCVTDSEAVRHLMDRAVWSFGDGLEMSPDSYQLKTGGARVRLAVPFEQLRSWYLRDDENENLYRWRDE